MQEQPSEQNQDNEMPVDEQKQEDKMPVDKKRSASGRIARFISWLYLRANFIINFIIGYIALNATKIASGGILIKFVSVSSVSLVLAGLLEYVRGVWALTPTLFASPTSKLCCMVGVIVIGRIFYLVRNYRPFWYAVVEMSVAVVTAYLAAEKLSKVGESLAGMAALLSSVYLAVRAWDNFSKKPKPFEARGLSTAIRAAYLKARS